MGVFEWTERESGLSNDILGIATNGADLWIIVGSSRNVATSPDGVNWTTIDVSAIFDPTDYIYDVCYNGSDMWMIVGSSTDDINGKIATSPDGIVWTEQTPDILDGFIGICYGNGIWIVTSWCTGLPGTIQTSPDGINWTQQTYSGNGLRTVEYNGTDLYAATDWEGENVVTSPDGITWTIANINMSMPWGIAHNQIDLWVIYSTFGKIITSPDGLVWSEEKPGFTHGKCVKFGNGNWLGADYDQIVLSADNTETWSIETSFPVSMNDVTMAYGSNMWIVAGTNGTLLTGESMAPDSSKTDLGTTRKTFWLNKTKKR